MKAFNQRFHPKEWFGLPRAAAGGCMLSLVLLVFSLVAPTPVRMVTVPALLCSLGFVWYAFTLGDDWEFRAVMSRARAERDCVTSETWTAT